MISYMFLVTNTRRMLSNISEKAHTVSVGWLDELSYIGNLTTFQQLDFTNGKTASVFLQLHIWRSLLLRQAEAGSLCDSAPLESCSLPGPDNTGLLWGALAPQAVESAYLINIRKTSVWTANYRKKWSNAILGTSLFIFAVANLNRCISCYPLLVWVLERKSASSLQRGWSWDDHIYAGRGKGGSPRYEKKKTLSH